MSAYYSVWKCQTRKMCVYAVLNGNYKYVCIFSDDVKCAQNRLKMLNTILILQNLITIQYVTASVIRSATEATTHSEIIILNSNDEIINSNNNTTIADDTHASWITLALVAVSLGGITIFIMYMMLYLWKTRVKE
jgi:hypothetical protein